MSLAALAVIAGHAYPVFLQFRGGKAVASFVGAFLCLAPWAMAVEMVVFVGVVAWTRHISLGSIVGRGHCSAGGVAGTASFDIPGDSCRRRRRFHHL